MNTKIQNILSLDEIHDGTLMILKKIIAICDEINIDYFLWYGSLIGAVRHQGFIPWDDDLDVMMLRPAYDEFRNYCVSHEKELYPFRFFDKDNTDGYPYGIGRFNDLRYKMKRKDSLTTAGQGMFVDIYPYDGAGNDYKDAVHKIQNKKRYLLKMLSCSYSKSVIPILASKWTIPIRIPAYIYAHIKGSKYFLDKLCDLKNTFSYDKSNYVTCAVWEDSLCFVEKKSFDSYEKLLFEGIEVKVPQNYHEILLSIYGDYFLLPPVEERKPNHGYSLYRK